MSKIRLLVAILVLVILAAMPRLAWAGVEFCQREPVIMVNGQPVHVTATVPNGSINPGELEHAVRALTVEQTPLTDGAVHVVVRFTVPGNGFSVTGQASSRPFGQGTLYAEATAAAGQSVVLAFDVAAK